MSFFKKLNRKQRRQFDKLDKEEKKEIIAHEINEKVKASTQRMIATAFADGHLFCSKMLYEKYFERYKSAKQREKAKIADEIMAEISVGYNKYNELHSPKKEEIKESE